MIYDRKEKEERKIPRRERVVIGKKKNMHVVTYLA